MLPYKSSLSEMQSRININVLFPSPGLQQCWHTGSPLCHQVILCKYPLTGTLHPEQLPAPEWAERPDKLVLFSKEARVGERKCVMSMWRTVSHNECRSFRSYCEAYGVFTLTFKNFDSCLNFLANQTTKIAWDSAQCLNY